MAERIQEIDQEIKRIKAFYGRKQDEIIAHRNELKAKINILKQNIDITNEQIRAIKREMHQLGQKFDALQHDCKVATHPLRAEKHAYMEKLRYEILAFENKQNS